MAYSFQFPDFFCEPPYEFPHTRNFHSDFGEILKLYMSVKDLPEQWVQYQQTVNGQWEQYQQTVNGEISGIDGRVTAVEGQMSQLRMDYAAFESAMENSWANYKTQFESDWTAYQEEVNTGFQNLRNFVNTFFEDLDVQQEINDKIDSMAQSGDLLTLLLPTVEDTVEMWLDEHWSNYLEPIIVRPTIEEPFDPFNCPTSYLYKQLVISPVNSNPNALVGFPKLGKMTTDGNMNQQESPIYYCYISKTSPNASRRIAKVRESVCGIEYILTRSQTEHINTSWLWQSAFHTLFLKGDSNTLDLNNILFNGIIRLAENLPIINQPSNYPTGVKYFMSINMTSPFSQGANRIAQYIGSSPLNMLYSRNITINADGSVTIGNWNAIDQRATLSNLNTSSLSIEIENIEEDS